MTNAQPAPEPNERRGFWSKLRDNWFGQEEDEYEDDEDAPEQNPSNTHSAAAISTRQNTLRMQTARQHNVAVRTNAQVFEDAKTAADGFKRGEQQIVNLEHATPQMAERIIDFLNGTTYALDGTVERVGEKVYLFAPANVVVEVDEGVKIPANPAPRRIFGERRERE